MLVMGLLIEAIRKIVSGLMAMPDSTSWLPNAFAADLSMTRDQRDRPRDLFAGHMILEQAVDLVELCCIEFQLVGTGAGHASPALDDPNASE